MTYTVGQLHGEWFHFGGCGVVVGGFLGVGVGFGLILVLGVVCTEVGGCVHDEAGNVNNGSGRCAGGIRLGIIRQDSCNTKAKEQSKAH